MRETAAGGRRLGRGLEALLGPTREEAQREGSLVELPIKDIRPNPFQPRKTVDPTALEELVSSIKQAGLLQPIVVRRANGVTEEVPVTLRIDTPIEVDYYLHGGILPYVLRQLIAQAPTG